MMKNLIGLLIILLFAGCDGPVVKVPVPTPSPKPEPTTTSATTTQQPPSAPSENLSVLIVTAPEWQVNEARGWNGTLVRRGDSNIFDLHHTNSDNGEVEDRVVTVTVKGRNVVGERNDSVHYQGTISDDGKRIDGKVWNDSGNTGNWTVWVDNKPATTVVSLDPPHTLAPDGVFFLLEKQSVTIPDGIKGFPRGTQVERIEDRGDKLLVKSGEWQFEVSKGDLTNDATLADSISSADLLAQHNAYEKAQAILAAERAEKEKQWKEQQEKVAAAQARQQNAADEELRGRIRGALIAQDSLDRSAYNQKRIVPRNTGYSSGSAGSPAAGYTAANQANQMQKLKDAQEATMKSQIQTLKDQENAGRYHDEDAARTRRQLELKLQDLQYQDPQ